MGKVKGNHPLSRLILFCGAPATGKTTLAKTISKKLKLPLFEKDVIESTLLQAGDKGGLTSQARLAFASYEILLAMADEQLKLGLSCVVDCVGSLRKVRDQFQNLARKNQAVFQGIFCHCSDAELHQKRLEKRTRGLNGQREPTWEEVVQVMKKFEPCPIEYLRVDSKEPFGEALIKERFQ